jgi:hypothetical protein
MRWLTVARFAALFTVSATVAAPLAQAADPCDGFTWNVSHERALFASSATELTAGSDSASAPLLAPERLYTLQLRPLGQVTFVTTPGKKGGSDGGYAGVAALVITQPGSYRIALDVPLWVDVVADGGLMANKGFQGASGCSAPHKIVEFEFPVARQVMLQFSGTTATSVRIGITASGR